MPVVLVVDDDPEELGLLARRLGALGCEVETARSLLESRERVSTRRPDLVVCSVGLPDDGGLSLLRELEGDPPVEVILTTTGPTVATAVAALRHGALDYLVKPIPDEELRRAVEAALGPPGRADLDDAPEEGPGRVTRLGGMITVSPSVRRVFKRIEKVAPSDITVLLVGESGTGKELVARTIHDLSARASGPFLAVNCGAVAPTVIESELFGHERGSFTGAERRHQGYFERASAGTLLLDELTEMTPDLQVKLLRVLETGTVTRVGGTAPVKASPRIIASTNCRPESAVAEGTLREDLFYRLKVFTIRLPTLRERGPRDVELLARDILDELDRGASSGKTLTAEALGLLKAHTWPGNVRELRNTIQAAWILADREIDLACLGLTAREVTAGSAGAREPVITIEVGSSIAEAERELILRTLEHFRGDKRRASRTLGISLKTLYNRLNRYRAGRG